MDPNQQPPQSFGTPPAQAPPLPEQPPVSAAQVPPAQPVPPTQPAIPQQPTTTAPPQPKHKVDTSSTQNSLEIAEVRDGIVIMNDGSFRAVVMCQSINFDLMSPEEREAVEFSYQGFLNSLYFDIQIFIRSQKVDLRPYLEKLDKIRSEHDNMLLALLMEDYINYMAAVAAQTNIMDKKFYIVIDFHPLVNAQKAVNASKSFFSTIFGKKEQHVVVNEADLEAAKTELKNRIQTVMAGLQQCQVNSIPLDTQELIELYYDAYNPDTATRQQMKNFNDLTSPVVSKGRGAAPQPNLNKELV